MKCTFKMRRMPFLAVAAMAAAACAAPLEIGEAFSDASFWKSNPVMFVKKHQDNGFKFTDENREGADSRLGGGVTCFGLPVYESRIAFDGNNGISRVELMLYTTAGTERRSVIDLGDGRKRISQERQEEAPITRDQFVDIMKKVRAELTPSGGKAPQQVAENLHMRNVVQKSQTWPKTDMPSVATLTWNYTQEGKKANTFKPGFVRLVVEGPAALAQAKSSGGANAKKLAKGTKSIVDNVVRDPRGDVFIDNVPMVDQGQKGYCAAATSERVLRYYGVSVDEHEIAQAAGTSAEEGTTSKGMKDSVAAVGKKYKLATVVTYGDFEKPVEERIDGLLKEAANYNKAAKKLKKKEITEDVFVTRHGNMMTFNPRALDEAMDPEVLLEMKVNGSQKSKFKKFMADIHQQVDKGIPLFWGLTLGIYPEADIPQARGGHMRLIIGYNDKKGEVLYTDTWGKGHELKRMPADWAFTASHCLMYMKPLR